MQHDTNRIVLADAVVPFAAVAGRRGRSHGDGGTRAPLPLRGPRTRGAALILGAAVGVALALNVGCAATAKFHDPGCSEAHRMCVRTCAVQHPATPIAPELDSLGYACAVRCEREGRECEKRATEVERPGAPGGEP